MTIAGIDTVGSMWMAGFGAQLFFLGAGLVVLKLLSGREKITIALPVIIFLVLASAGLMLIGIADQAYCRRHRRDNQEHARVRWPAATSYL